MSDVKEKKKPHKMFKYDAAVIEHQLMSIAAECQRELQEAFATNNMRQFILSFESGYRQALLDYGIVTEKDINNG